MKFLEKTYDEILFYLKNSLNKALNNEYFDCVKYAQNNGAVEPDNLDVLIKNYNDKLKVSKKKFEDFWENNKKILFWDTGEKDLLDEIRESCKEDKLY